MPIVCVVFLLIPISIEFHLLTAKEESGGFNLLYFFKLTLLLKC